MENQARNCKKCSSEFTSSAEDLNFYEKIGVSQPTTCPPCRAQLRLSFRNERAFYKRPCDKCKKDTVSMYSPNKAYTVWCYECWFSDDWDATDYGVDYDPSRPFLEQFKALWESVPKVALIYVRSVNSEYVNIAADNKDCYMIVESSNNEGCSYCYWIQKCKDSIDTSFAHQCEFCYESDDCFDCYKVMYSKGCHDCRESYFLFDCKDVSNSIGCTNLRSRQYCVFNEQLSKEEYEQFVRDSRLDTWGGVEKLREKFSEFLKTQPKKYAETLQAENSTGNYMKNSKNCSSCFHCYDAEDCKYAEHVWRNAKDCMDVSTVGRNASMVYNSINTAIDVGNCICCAQAWSSTFLEYCANCFNSNHCFGSAGLRKKDYCILNKQYSKEKYEKLKAQILEKIENYGEFFSPDISTFGYNETVAQEQFPLTKEEAISQGFKWEDAGRGTFGKETVDWNDMPNSMDVSKEIFACVGCKKNYRIIPREYEFYQNLKIPLPRLCPDCRHERRIKVRGPNRLSQKQCSCDYKVYINSLTHEHHKEGRCQNKFKTTYENEKDILYCEQCYNLEVA